MFALVSVSLKFELALSDAS